MLHTLRRWLKWWLPQVGQTSKKEQESEQVEDWSWIDYLRGETSIRDMPSYAEQNEQTTQGPRREQPPLEMVEYPVGWPPPVNTD
jgi:hypothetical protein